MELPTKQERETWLELYEGTDALIEQCILRLLALADNLESLLADSRQCTAQAMKRIADMENRIATLDQLNVDACADDAAIRDLCRPIIGDFLADGDTYGVPGVVDVVKDTIDKTGKMIDDCGKAMAIIENRIERAKAVGHSFFCNKDDEHGLPCDCPMREVIAALEGATNEKA